MQCSPEVCATMQEGLPSVLAYPVCCIAKALLYPYLEVMEQA